MTLDLWKCLWRLVTERKADSQAPTWYLPSGTPEDFWVDLDFCVDSLFIYQVDNGTHKPPAAPKVFQGERKKNKRFETCSAQARLCVHGSM